MAMAEVSTVFMICENIVGPYAYDIYAIKPSDHHNIHGEKYSRSSCYSSSCSSQQRRSIPKIPSPVYRMKRELYAYGMGFFSIGSKIYMIGGEEFKDDDEEDGSSLDVSNRVHVYDTITSTIEEGPPMVSGKSYPIVIGPIDGKFYIISYNLCAHDLEQFDQESRTWLQLPPPPPSVPLFCRRGAIPPQEYEINAQVAVAHTILLSTRSGRIFSFHVITHTWCEIRDSTSILPFVGRAVFTADEDDHRWFAFSNDHDGDYDDHFPFCAFRIHHPYRFVGDGPVKKLRPPIRPICDVQRQGHVNYLGKQHFCIVRSGHTDSPFYYERHPPKHYVTIDLFRVHSNNKSDNHVSLSFIMDDTYDGDDATDSMRTIRFSVPI